jgi:DNA-binding transcriptional regulator YhcF (GntR family)
VKRGKGTFISARSSGAKGRRVDEVARQIAERMLREGFRHGLLPSDLMKALKEVSPARER